MRIMFNLLLSGRQIYYSDKLPTRLLSYKEKLSSLSYSEFTITQYEFVHNNFEILSRLFDFIGFKLCKCKHLLSDNEKFSYFYYFTSFSETKNILKKEFSLDKADILILSSLFLKTYSGLSFIDLEEFINDFIENPEKLLFSDVNLEILSELYIKKKHLIGSSTENIKNSIKNKIKEKIQNLSKYDYIHLINDKHQEMKIISPAPPIYKLTQQIQNLKRDIE
jgi:hypothetical protein